MRTKKVQISEEESQFQKELDKTVRIYEDRISRLIKVRDSLRKIRKCQYCGGRYYSNGLCVNCYNIMRRCGGDEEKFKESRTRYGFRKNPNPEWKKKFYKDVFKSAEDIPEDKVIFEWVSRVISCLRDDDVLVLKHIYEEGWSLRGCANLMKRERGWVIGRLTSIKTIASKVKVEEKREEKEGA